MKKRIVLVAVLTFVCVALLCVMYYFALPSDAAETVLPHEDIPMYSGGGLDRLGILQGTEKGFEPERRVTRAEAVVFIMRTLKTDANITFFEHPFEDVKSHWAEKDILNFYGLGFVQGTSESTFSPDKPVSGREFAKMMLCSMGYEGITLENAAEKGKEYEILTNNFTKSVVVADYELLRSDVLRICHSVLTAELAEGTRVYQRWINKGGYTMESFEGILWCGLPAEKSFSGKINSFMPKDENYVFSPISLKMALSLAANGAEGETAEELLELIGEESIEELNVQNRALMEKYSKTNALYLWFANSVWLNESTVPGMEFQKEFMKNAKLYFAADAFKVKQSDAVKKINNWVKEKTNGKIGEIVSETDFDAALINAVYFKASWMNRFEEDFNSEETFTSRDGNKKKITFMNETAYYPYGTAGDIQIIELPYDNYEEIRDEDGKYIDGMHHNDLDVSMYILMGDVDDPAKVIEATTLNNTYVELSLPRFKIETASDMKKILEMLGVNKAFDMASADFTSMAEPGNLYIQDVKQKAIIEVNEDGTEAAAVTAIMAGATSIMRPEPVVFRADKPFTFVVRDNVSGEILFMGEYAFA